MSLIKKPLSEIKDTPNKEGFYNLMKDRWWAVDKDNNVFIGTNGGAMCNSNKKIAAALIGTKTMGIIKIVFVEKAWVEVDPGHYC